MINYLNTKVGVYKFKEYVDKQTGELKKAYPFSHESTLIECLEYFDAVDIITKYRETKQQELKEQIPAFTPAGLYNGKRIASENPSQCTNLVQIDIDASLNQWVDDWATLRDELFDQCPFIAVAGLSCSGKGIFLLANTPGWEGYENYFYALREYIDKTFKITVDDAVGSPNELRYVTIPNDIRIRENAELWVHKADKPRNIIGSDTKLLGNGIRPEIPSSIAGKMHYPDVCSYIGLCNSVGVNIDELKKFFNTADVIDSTSSLYGRPQSVMTLIDKIYKTYSNQFGQIIDKPVPKTKKQEQKDFEERVRRHCYLIRSVRASNKFAHVIVDEQNICEYFESTAGGKISEPAQQRLSQILGFKKWYNLKNEMLNVFDEKAVQRDTADTCYLYFKNGTLAIKANNIAFIQGESRPMIWKSLVLNRNYIQTTVLHPIVEIGKKVVTDYKKLQIGLGYLLHRNWQRNMTKIVWACDNNPTSDHDGRRGKDLFLKLTEKCRMLTSVKWKRNHNFWTGSITPETSIVHFEDVSPWLANDDEIKRAITGELQIEGKGRDIIVRPFDDKPKFSASCQKIPADYADESIRGRVWLIEFTDYLQKNPPDKILVYDDNEDQLAAFDKWVIECIQVYFQNQKMLQGIPQINDEELKNVCISNYGLPMVSACYDIKNTLESQPFTVPVSTAKEWAGVPEGDQRQLDRLKKCFHLLTKNTLLTRRIGAEKVTHFYVKNPLENSVTTQIENDKCPF
jgi:hypothetical protein